MNYADALTLAVVVCLVAYGVGCALLLRRSRDPAMGMTMLLAPYWTIGGAIPVLLSKRADPAFRYTYLEDKLFPLYPDSTYGLVLLSYVIFLSGGLIGVAMLTRATSPDDRSASVERWSGYASRFSHGLLFWTCGLLTVIKLALMVYLVGQVDSGSLYLATRVVRGENAMMLRAYQYLNIVAGYPVAAGFVIWLCFPSVRGRTPRRRLTIWSAYVLLLLLAVGENALLGNRAVPLVLMAAIAAGWIRWRYLPADRSEKGPLRRRFLIAGFSAFLVLGTIGISRGGSLDSPGSVADSLGSNFVQVGNVVVQSTRSAESVAAHMSLYGVLTEPQRPRLPLAANSYLQYTTSVSVSSDQVFTVHYVTAWWMRLGPLGLIPAVASFALVVAGFQRLASREITIRWAGAALAAATLPAAGIPIILLRSGPESLRAIIVELLILPSCVLVPCFVVGHRRHRPVGSDAVLA